MARLQTYQTEDGVRVPEVLQQYMPGKIDFFPFVRDCLLYTSDAADE